MFCQINNCEAELRSSIVDNDLKKLKKLLESNPFLIQTCDVNSNNLLQFSIIQDKYEIFLYFLSLNRFDLEAENGQKETALLLSITTVVENEYLAEKYAIALINAGANIYSFCEDNNSLLHLALSRHQFQISRVLIEKGIDINLQNIDGATPLHMIFQNKIYPERIVDGVGLLLYYGADPSICDKNQNVPFELAALYDPSIITAQENLFFATFDEYSEYEISVEVLMELLENRSPLLFQIADYVKDVYFIKAFLDSYNPTMIFELEPEFLHLLIDKFPSAVREITAHRVPTFWYTFSASRLENWEILLNSNVGRDVVEFIGKLNLELLMGKLQERDTPTQAVVDFVYYLLSYGLRVFGRDMQHVYQVYGYCELFKILLHMEIQPYMCDIWPRYIFDMQLDLDVFLDDPHNFSIKAIEELLGFFSRRKLKNFCYKLNLKQLKTKVESLPEVPLLAELSRDATRSFLIRKFRLKNSSQFYTILNCLHLNVYLKRILSFQTKLYSY